ncbi:SET domain-containing protein [Hortaea werneckii]|nr:SET domain-containing protein [Hortaea werneckii]
MASASPIKSPNITATNTALPKKRPTLTRSHSTDSSSALSNIDVSAALQAAAAASDDSSVRGDNDDDDDDDDDRDALEPEASTPPTSLAESGGSQGRGSGVKMGKMERVEEHVEAESSGRKSRRARASGVRTYNLKDLSDAQQPLLPSTADAPREGNARQRVGSSAATASRNVSGLTGKTLVSGHEEDEEGTPLAGRLEKALEMELELPEDGEAVDDDLEKMGVSKPKRRPSVKERVRKGLGKVGSVLGKRGRELLGGGGRGKKAAKASASTTPAVEDDVAVGQEEQEDLPRWKKQLDTGTKGVLDELDLDAELPAPPPAKKARTSAKAPMREIPQPPAAPIPTAKALTTGKKMKKWQKEGLYVGQAPGVDPSVPPSSRSKKLQKKSARPSSSASQSAETSSEANFDGPRRSNSTLRLPMFSYLEKTRPFTIPYDIFAPSLRKGDERPRDWHQLNKNRLVGEAKDLWERTVKGLPPSLCVCTPPTAPGEQGCDECCLNRVMQYECNSTNCSLPPDQCSNRAFASLTTRIKRGGPFDIGVEVIKTPTRGFGVRSCRSFAPGQIIMEYTGEIITESECQRRMREVYKNMHCYYLMELERGLIIDGTRGSMARFINHSCKPNCEVRMVKVNGTPRMGVFAGEDGVTTGEELSYDYNFDNFGTERQVCYCGAQGCRGFLSKRLNKEEMKRLVAKEEAEERERLRKAAEEEREREKSRKKAGGAGNEEAGKRDRGSGWRGWISLDDAETRERLKREKKEKEEAEKGSARALRMARRAGDGDETLLSTSTSSKAEEKKQDKKTGSKKRASPVDVEATTASAPLSEAQEVAEEAVLPSIEAPSSGKDDTVPAANLISNPKESSSSNDSDPAAAKSEDLKKDAEAEQQRPGEDVSHSPKRRKTSHSSNRPLSSRSKFHEQLSTDNLIDGGKQVHDSNTAGTADESNPLPTSAASLESSLAHAAEEAMEEEIVLYSPPRPSTSSDKSQKIGDEPEKEEDDESANRPLVPTAAKETSKKRKRSIAAGSGGLVDKAKKSLGKAVKGGFGTGSRKTTAATAAPAGDGSGAATTAGGSGKAKLKQSTLNFGRKA